jgi:cytochrome d ubiquinol oxidase subunit I
VFSTGIIYILRLMAQPPQPGEHGPPSDVPTRAAGITLAAATASAEGALG